MVVALVGALTLADAVSAHEYLGIAVLGCGILLMARGVFTAAEDRRLLPFALGSAAATATYTLIDGLGARVNYVGGLPRVLPLPWQGEATAKTEPPCPGPLPWSRDLLIGLGLPRF